MDSPSRREVTIRKAIYDDALAIATLHIATWQAAYRGHIPDEYLDSLSLDARLGRWQGILDTEIVPKCTFVAECAGQITAFATVGQCRDVDGTPTTGELYALYVAPGAMNQGVGSGLISFGQKHLLDHNFTRATLWVLESNQRARRFYESKGWAADGLTRSEEIGGVAIPEVRYAITFHSQS
jgi:ribosomal protein S18 acetylase RimI-like enzyme